MRFNEDLGTLEFYTGDEWRTVNSFKDTGNRGRAFNLVVDRNQVNLTDNRNYHIQTSSSRKCKDFGDLHALLESCWCMFKFNKRIILLVEETLTDR